mgnify:CR=1 FL=1
MGGALRIGFVRRQAWLNVIKMFELKLRRSFAVVKFVHMNAASRAAGIYHDGILHDRATPAIGIVHRRRITTPARERGVVVQLRGEAAAAALLADLVREGVLVSHFAPEGSRLENAYLGLHLEGPRTEGDRP